MYNYNKECKFNFILNFQLLYTMSLLSIRTKKYTQRCIQKTLKIGEMEKPDG